MVESYYDISAPTAERNVFLIIEAFLGISTSGFMCTFSVESCRIRFVYELSGSRNKFVYLITVNGISGSKRSFLGCFATFHRNIDTDFIYAGGRNIPGKNGCLRILIIVFHRKSKCVFSGLGRFESVYQRIGSVDFLSVQTPLVRRFGIYRHVGTNKQGTTQFYIFRVIFGKVQR